MTVVCAVRDGRVVLMCADSAATSDTGHRVLRRDSKMFRLRVPWGRGLHRPPCEMLLGLCGEYHRLQLVACSFRPPRMQQQDPWAYIVSSFVPALRRFMEIHFGGGKEDDFMDGSSELLIAFQGRIFTLYSNGQVQETRDRFASIGGGAEIALGAMHCAAQTPQAASWEVLDSGMYAAEAFHSTVLRPFVTEVLYSN